MRLLLVIFTIVCCIAAYPNRHVRQTTDGDDTPWWLNPANIDDGEEESRVVPPNNPFDGVESAEPQANVNNPFGQPEGTDNEPSLAEQPNPTYNSNNNQPDNYNNQPDNYDNSQSNNYGSNTNQGGDYQNEPDRIANQGGDYNNNQGDAYNSNQGGDYNSNQGGDYNNNQGDDYNANSNQNQGADYNTNQGSDYSANNVGCECVPYFLCRENEIITDGAGIIDIRFGPTIDNTSTTRLNSNSKCPHFVDVCCGGTPLPEPEISTVTPYRAKCGTRNPYGVNARILGFQDNEAQFGEFPWMAAILRTEEITPGKEVNLYVCGGSLIHPQVVMTAAHCVHEKNYKLKVRLGEWDTQNSNELYDHVDRYVVETVVHPGFYSAALFNDVALLFLDYPVELTSHIDTICLPGRHDEFNYTDCVASGWGKDSFDDGQYQNILKQINLPLVDHYGCQDALRETRLGNRFRLHDSFLCAGGVKGLDTCKGDGGSPLACPNPYNSDYYVQAGIVAWGIGCGEDGTPGVYVDVREVVDWIDSELDAYLSV